MMTYLLLLLKEHFRQYWYRPILLWNTARLLQSMERLQHFRKLA